MTDRNIYENSVATTNQQCDPAIENPSYIYETLSRCKNEVKNAVDASNHNETIIKLSMRKILFFSLVIGVSLILVIIVSSVVTAQVLMSYWTNELSTVSSNSEDIRNETLGEINRLQRIINSSKTENDLDISKLKLGINEMKLEMNQQGKELGGLEKTLNNTVEDFQRKVEFLVYLSRNLYDYAWSRTIVFDREYFNEGDGYNRTNGYFTAPLDGLYSFYAQVNVYGSSGSFYNFYIRTSKGVISSSYTGIGFTDTATLHTRLEVGDRAWVTQHSYLSSTQYLRATYTLFNGVLIK